jgi:hypothetical protein
MPVLNCLKKVYKLFNSASSCLECGDIIFHAKDLGRSFGHADYTKWKWEDLFHNRISWQGVVCGVSLNDLLDHGLLRYSLPSPKSQPPPG